MGTGMARVALVAAIGAIGALAACGTGDGSAQLPIATVGNPTATRDVRGGQRSEHIRAFAANCSSAGSATETGNCSNIELAGTSLGPATPAGAIPGLQPADLQAAYALPASTAGHGQTIGIVLIGNDPALESDLAVYRKTFGLPACTSAGGCLRVVAAPNVAAADLNWAHEASIDVDMASAVCPNCKLLVVEAAGSTALGLVSADATAVRNGATVLSNSFTIPESAKESSLIWWHPGVPVVAAAGDDGYTTANWPAAATGSIAVGATTLTRDTTARRGWTESAWAGSGSGCSAFAAKPTWQTDPGCSSRTVADVAAVGDPATPVAVYDSYLDSGWVEMGGTSVSTPIVAGVYALAGNGSQVNGAASLYAHRGSLNPVSSGTNGVCTTAYLCTAGNGYSGPAGLGTPNGTAAF